MPFGFDPIKMAKAEILKVDLDKDNIPDALEALDAGEKACDVIAVGLKKLDASDLVLVLNQLPSSVKAKLDIPALASAFAALPAALAAAKGVLEAVEAELKKK